MPGFRLKLKREFLFRFGFFISLPRVLDTFQQARHRRARINLAIDDQHWTRCNQRQHGRAIKAIRNARHHTLIKLADKIRFNFRHAFIFGGSIDGILKRPDARLPGIILKRPAKTLHADERNRNRHT